jgi:hypothetical protein
MRATQVVPVVLLAFAVACSSVQTAEDPTKPPPPKTTVEVKNLKTVDCNLYVLNGARQVRLGTVPGMATRNFVIPSHLVGESDRLRFGIEIIGTFMHKRAGTEPTITSEESLPMRPGEELSLTIQ